MRICEGPSRVPHGVAPAGNHAFAREFNDLVPDTWSIINDQVCACNLTLKR